LFFAAPRPCLAPAECLLTSGSFTDTDGITHIGHVAALSLYEAAVHGIAGAG
jgi:hypothetical protein